MSSRLSDRAASDTTASSARSASSEVSRAAVFARIFATPSRRFSCSARSAALMVSSCIDAGALLTHQQGNDLELGTSRRLQGSALGAGLDLTHGAGQDRDDALLVAVAGLTPASGGRSGGAWLALASSGQELLLSNAPAGWPWRWARCTRCGQTWRGNVEPSSPRWTLHEATRVNRSACIDIDEQRTPTLRPPARPPTIGRVPCRRPQGKGCRSTSGVAGVGVAQILAPARSWSLQHSKMGTADH